MPYKKPLKTTLMLIVLSFMMMGVVLLNGCAVPIKDEQFCSPIPGNLGATCDNFLTSNPLILDEAGWTALEQTWWTSGQTVECTNSNTLGDIKEEIEKLCSIAKCDLPTQALISKGLKKIQNLGKDRL